MLFIFLQLPFPKMRGVADSLLLTNLTRWRSLSWDWASTVAEVFLAFEDNIMSDQDIFNIILSEVCAFDII